MAESNAPHFNPETLAEISSLSIRAVQLVEGLLSGQHRSPHKGSSVEFAEYKDYTPGDDIRHIDWKVVGKTDKYHVKQFEQSTNLKCTLLVDASGSMAYESPDRKSTGMSKQEYTRTLVAAMSYLLLKQFDAAGLTLFNDQVVSHIPPRSKPSHFQNILKGLEEMEFRGVTRLGKVVGDLIERLPGRGMLILITDLLTRDDDVFKTLKLLSSRGLEVILFHILHPDEVNLPFEGDLVFESLEDDPELGLDPFDIRQQYRQTVHEQIESYRKNCPTLGIDYLFMETTDPLDQALRYYLLRRKSLRKI
ncbi:MAG: DUF58 domain-containing protein [Nitrospinaceae bacterium]|nr:DUF58 domain-containing protein [Nitrospinaceae bacterium]NIR56352.1 DUF58 domain-containing protein [Nitrospinaceae bacterium]NIS86812.1 DUF58 domain-containing protein [Nitrospinaceae bacterium]NIT83646.1 DUF58 domain-containing protein [Nitrospinaceae bacterium]NIU45849.1 DUF58 domain-containing protein [Nitrospinaceae bacterium]